MSQIGFIRWDWSLGRHDSAEKSFYFKEVWRILLGSLVNLYNLKLAIMLLKLNIVQVSYSASIV